jgi:hypothetical protein
MPQLVVTLSPTHNKIPNMQLILRVSECFACKRLHFCTDNLDCIPLISRFDLKRSQASLKVFSDCNSVKPHPPSRSLYPDALSRLSCSSVSDVCFGVATLSSNVLRLEAALLILNDYSPYRCSSSASGGIPPLFCVHLTVVDGRMPCCGLKS